MTTLLSSNEAASFLNYSSATLRNSRCTGKLAGVTAPPHRKLGTVVRYETAKLTEWLEQFSEINHAEQAKEA